MAQNGKETEKVIAVETREITKDRPAETSNIQVDNVKLLNEPQTKVIEVKEKKRRGSSGPWTNILYDPKRKTVLGRDGLNWAKLAAFYTVFYFFLGCFFVGLLYVFALQLDRHVPTYYNQESTMAVRTTSTVVGMGFRPQPAIDDNLIIVSDDPHQQARIASSLRLYRDVFLIQKADARVETCSDKDPASDLPQGVACTFNWFHVVPTQDHPCSDNNMYGFKNAQPCVLVKLNKVFGWVPNKGALPVHIQKLRGLATNKSINDPDVYITCDGTHAADRDAITSMIYYSSERTSGSTKYGVIPNYFFPYRNAKDHVQPFILVQFKNLPYNRLIGVTCKAWSPGMEHDSRAMRGMVNFQLIRTRTTTNQNGKGS